MIHAFAINYDTMQLLKCMVRYYGGLRFKIKGQNLFSIKVTRYKQPTKRPFHYTASADKTPQNNAKSSSRTTCIELQK